MSIKAKRVKSGEARTKGRKGAVQRAGMLESTTEVTITKQQNDAENSEPFLICPIFVKTLTNSSTNQTNVKHVRTP